MRKVSKRPGQLQAGGLSTRLHAACIDECAGVSFGPSGGERHDAMGLEPVWEGVAASPVVMAVVVDKA